MGVQIFKSLMLLSLNVGILLKDKTVSYLFFSFQNYTAEVFHIPFGAISLGNSMFLMPSYSRLCPLIGSDLHQVELQYNNRAGKVRIQN